MSDMIGVPFPEHALAESAGDHIRNSLIMLGALQRIITRSAGERPDALALVEAISARLDQALQQVETR